MVNKQKATQGDAKEKAAEARMELDAMRMQQILKDAELEVEMEKKS